MTREDALQQIQDIVRDILKQTALVLHETDQAQNVDGWDSLTHMTIIAAIEKHFSIKLSFMEVVNLESIGDLVEIVIDKVG